MCGRPAEQAASQSSLGHTSDRASRIGTVKSSWPCTKSCTPGNNGWWEEIPSSVTSLHPGVLRFSLHPGPCQVWRSGLDRLPSSRSHRACPAPPHTAPRCCPRRQPLSRRWQPATPQSVLVRPPRVLLLWRIATRSAAALEGVLANTHLTALSSWHVCWATTSKVSPLTP